MGPNKIVLMAAALMAGPLAANASTVTYDFAGTVTSSSGTYSSVAVALASKPSGRG
jgi:hypothetical protein